MTTASPFQINNVSLDDILPNPWQTRTAEPEVDYIKELAQDIAKNGLLQVPIGRVDPEDSKSVQLAFGHNRLAAFVHLANSHPDGSMQSPYAAMPVDVRDLSDEQMANFAWSENEKRRDVTAIERARAIERRMQDFGWTNRLTAENLGIDHSTISNILRLLKLPEYLQDAIQDGKLSERAAQSILVLFELPEFAEYPYGMTKKEIIRSALGGASSDNLREMVDRYLLTNSEKLKDAEFELTQLIPEVGNVYCGLCSTCDKRQANRNLCFDKLCFEAKTAWVRHKYLEGASLATGFNILDPDKSGYPTTLYGQQVEKIKAAKCPNLVLAYGGERSKELEVPGFPKAHLTCEKRNQSCTCIKGLRANLVKSVDEPEYIPFGEEALQDEGEEIRETAPAHAPAITSADLEEAARQERRLKKRAVELHGEMTERVIKRLTDGFRDDQPGAFYLAAHRYAYPSKTIDIEACYKEMALNLVRIIVSGPYDSPEQMTELVNRKLDILGLEPVSLEKTLVEVFVEQAQNFGLEADND